MYLNCHSYFSLKYGILSPEQLLALGADLGVANLALTDINNTSGCIDFVRLAPKYGIRPVVGIDFRQGAKQLYVGLARNKEGFRQLNEHLSAHIMEHKPVPVLAPEMPDTYVIYPWGSRHVDDLRPNEYLGIRPHELNKLRFSRFAHSTHRMVLLQPVTFRDKADFNTHRLLRAVDNNTLLSKLPRTEQGLENERMYAAAELNGLCREYPQLMINTLQLLNACSIDFSFGTNKNRKLFFQNREEDRVRLRQLAEEGLHYRYPDAGEVQWTRLNKELSTIFELDFTSYFLINWDILRYARSKGYFYVGRGSGANSLVAYCLRITDVDPIELDLYFERFINPSRKNPPDFDIDFSWTDRNDITEYIFEKHPHTALLATYSTFQPRAIARELGKVLGLPPGEIDRMEGGQRLEGDLDGYARLVKQYGRRIVDFPSHLSIHAGGILIADQPLTYFTSLNMPPKGFPTTQFSMLEAEDVGLHKFDILSQRGLGHIRDAVEIVRGNREEEIDIHDIPAFKQDRRIRELLREGDTIGCFYVESPAMRQLLKKLQADHYEGLVAASSIIRPGVSSSGMMREYILRFRFPEKRKEAIPAMMDIMPETFGVMVYQEDVIRVAHEYAGLSLEESDVMRRGMSGKYRSREEFRRVKEKFFNNCRELGRHESEAAEIWRQIESFAGYSFAKGHSASYAVESYQSLYLKAHYPLEFMVGVINNFGGFYATEYYLHEARMSGAEIELPCVNRSHAQTWIDGHTIFIGFQHIKELEQQTTIGILEARRRGGPFKGLLDLLKRVQISLQQLRLLIRIEAFRFTGKTKKELLWDAHLYLGEKKKSELPTAELFAEPPVSYEMPSLEQDFYEDALDQIELLGFPLNSPFDILASEDRGQIGAAEMGEHLGETVRMVGYLVTTKPVKTILGDRMSFGCFIDAQGDFFDTVHFPPSLARYPFSGRAVYVLHGRVTEEFDVTSLEVQRMERMQWIFDQDDTALAKQVKPSQKGEQVRRSFE